MSRPLMVPVTATAERVLRNWIRSCRIVVPLAADAGHGASAESANTSVTLRHEIALALKLIKPLSDTVLVEKFRVTQFDPFSTINDVAR